MIGQETLAIAPARTGLDRVEKIAITFFGFGFSVLSFYLLLTYSTGLLAAANIMPAWLAKLVGAVLGGPAMIVVVAIAVVGGIFLAVRRDLQKGNPAGWRKFDYWTTTIVRYFLAYVFLIYGFAKIFHTQFTTFLGTLDTPLGKISGFDLTWRFFGYSEAYAWFIAGSQILCSLLFFFRRTTTLGAAILLPIISNIVFVNFAFGVPVKLMSSIFLVMALFLLLPEWRRFKALFWDNAPMGAPTFATADFRMDGPRIALKTAIIVILIALPMVQLSRAYSDMMSATTPLVGTWRVQQYKSNGQALPASDPQAWKKFYVDSDKFVEIRLQRIRPMVLSSKFDKAMHTVTIGHLSAMDVPKSGAAKPPFFKGTYAMGPYGTLTLDGTGDKNAKIEVTLTREKNTD